MFTEKITDSKLEAMLKSYLTLAIGKNEHYENCGVLFRNPDNGRATMAFYPEDENLNNYFVICDDFKVMLDCPQKQDSLEQVNLLHKQNMYSIFGDEYIKAYETLIKSSSKPGNRYKVYKQLNQTIDQIKNTTEPEL